MKSFNDLHICTLTVLIIIFYVLKFTYHFSSQLISEFSHLVSLCDHLLVILILLCIILLLFV